MAPKKIDIKKYCEPVDVQAGSEKTKRSTFDVITEYFQSGRAGILHQVCDDHIRLTVELHNDDYEVFIDGLDDDPYHSITISSVWDIDLPPESTESILSAIKIINDFSASSSVSAFEFDQQLSFWTRLNMIYPVHERHIRYALNDHLGLVHRCLEPLLAIAFGSASVAAIATLFERPKSADMQ